MANDSERFDIGMKYRREVLGDEYVDHSMSNADAFNRDFQNFVTEYCWGGTWGRGVMGKRERSILNLGMLAALGKPEEFKIHFRGAIRNGVTLAELREICLQIGVYCGIPAGIEAFRLARQVLKAEGVDASSID